MAAMIVIQVVNICRVEEAIDTHLRQCDRWEVMFATTEQCGIEDTIVAGDPSG